MPAPIRIIGIGNPLMGDDGLGTAAVERLGALELPAGVEVVDGGTGGLTLLGLMEGAKAVILIDAAAMDRPAGTIVRLAPEAVGPGGGAGLSLHGTGLPDVFALARELDLLPPSVILYGVEPETVEPRLGLSEAVSAAVEPLLRQILDEISSLR